MAAGVVSANYQDLKKIAQQFSVQQKQIEQLSQSLKTTVDQLRGGGWVADAANQYYRNMDQHVFPSLKRLSNAMEHAQTATLEIIGIFRAAEEEACAGLPSGLSSSNFSPNIAGAASQMAGSETDWWDHQISDEDGGWNGATITEAKAIYVNGIQTSRGAFRDSLLDASKALGGVPVMGVYNATDGLVIDGAQAIADKFQIYFGQRILPVDNLAIKSLKEAIIQSDGRVPIVAHSQGGLSRQKL